jgi:outer membrane protein assembly factor BamB
LSFRKNFLLSLAIVAIAAQAPADDWPKWRGPQGDGIVREQGLATTWPEGGPKKLWSVKTGTGHASPVVVSGKVYLFTRDDEKNQEILTAYDAADGKQLWQQSYTGGYNPPTGTDSTWLGTRATPAIDGTRIYTYGGSGDLVCRDLNAEGKELWHVNVMTESKAEPIYWGESSSPFIDGDAVYVQGGVGQSAPVAIAINKTSGKVIWQSEARGVGKGKNANPTGGGYAAPIIANVGGTKQLVILGCEDLYGMDPATGKTLWHEDWVTQYDVNATTPIFSEGKLFITSGYGHACMMLELSATGAKKLWENKSLMSRFPQAILDRGAIYGVSDERGGILKCLDWASGKVKWEAKEPADRLDYGGSIVRFGRDYLIMLSDRGRLTLAKATPEAFTRIAFVKEITPGKNIWAAPTISNGKLYIKGVEELLCLDISGK